MRLCCFWRFWLFSAAGAVTCASHLYIDCKNFQALLYFARALAIIFVIESIKYDSVVSTEKLVRRRTHLHSRDSSYELSLEWTRSRQKPKRTAPLLVLVTAMGKNQNERPGWTTVNPNLAATGRAKARSCFINGVGRATCSLDHNDRRITYGNSS